MADPDAAKTGYNYKPQAKKQYVKASPRPRPTTYTPRPTYVPNTGFSPNPAFRPQKPVSYGDEKREPGNNPVSKNTRKKFQKQINDKPKGDFDNDGIQNSVDTNDFDKKSTPNKKANYQKEQNDTDKDVVRGAFFQAENNKQNTPSATFASKGDYAKVPGPGGSTIWYKAYWDKEGGNGIQYRVDHVEYKGVNYQDAPDSNHPKVINGPVWKNPDNNIHWKQAAKIEKKKELRKGSQYPVGDEDASDNNHWTGNSNFKEKNQLNKGFKARDKNQKISGGGDGFAKEMDVKTLMLKSSGNGDKLYKIFQKAYGDQASTKFSQTIENIKANSEFVVKEIGKPGQYGYTVAIKTKNGWTTDIGEVKNNLVKYVPAGTDSSSGQIVEQLKLAGTASGGLESSLSKRFGRAFHAGDEQKGNQSLMAAFNAYKAKNPGKIRFVGAPGETGSYIQVKINGQWVSSSDKVAKELSGFVKNTDTNKPIVANKQQKDLLMGANGNAVLNNFINKYGDIGTAQKNLKIAMNAYEKSNPGNDIRYFGNIGQPGFYIEVKTQNGWVNGTQTVLNKLDRYMPKTSPIATAPSASGGITESAFAPGATGPNQSAPSDSSTGSLPSEQANSQNPTTDSENSTDLGWAGSGETVGPEIGVEAGSQEFNQFDDRLRQWAGDRQQEKNSFNPNNSKNGAVDLGKAARKSEAMMAFDLDGNGEISAAEKSLMANGDQNNNGVVGEYGLKKFVAQADTNKSGLVSQAEVKAYNVVDTNNNNKLGSREIKAYGNVDTNNDGSITKKEAKQVVKDLRAQVDLSKQEKKDLDLAKQYLAKSNSKGGGAESVDQQVAALVNSQPKHEKQGDNGQRGGKKNKN